jgi:DNA-3-methyladenine glycosylase I
MPKNKATTGTKKIAAKKVSSHKAATKPRPVKKAVTNEMRATAQKPRCWWCEGDPLYMRYHDDEWGVPLHDDQKLFEMLVLEGFQAGLSWFTILRKRENFRKAFAGFDPAKVAGFGARDKKRLMKDASIIRNRAKIEAAINNAQCYCKVQEEFGTFDAYIWGFTKGRTLYNKNLSRANFPTHTKESDAISADMKKRGFKFVGTTIIYAHMQATGMVDDHLRGCFRYRKRGSPKEAASAP